MATIILSYRREDTELMVGRICDRLRDHYGRNSVMMDIDSIPYGLDFRKHIREALSRCDLMVAIIGPHWAALNDQGQSRLIDETDWIRIEIEAALAKDIPVIPVLVNGAPMPKPKDLPESMQDLAFRQAAPLDMRRDFHTHMDRLIGVMDELLTPKTEDEPVVIKQDHTAPEAEQRSAASASTKPLPPKSEERTAKAEIRKAQDEKAKTPPRAPTPKPAQPVHELAAASDQPLLQGIFVPDALRRDAQSSVLAANWWMVAWRGVLALVLGLVWLLGDAGYLNSLDMTIFVPLYMGTLLLDGALAIASGWRGARPNERFVPLILNGVFELLLGAWVVLQRLGMVRVPTDTAWPPPARILDGYRHRVHACRRHAARSRSRAEYALWPSLAYCRRSDVCRRRLIHHAEFKFGRIRVGRGLFDECDGRFIVRSRPPTSCARQRAGGPSVIPRGASVR
jgi:hypothetical protein